MTYQETFKLAVLPAQVYDAWLSEEMTIAPVFKIEVDPKVGGHFRLYAGSESQSFVMEGEFLELVPNQKIVYQWQWLGVEERTKVTVIFNPHQEGCTLELLHEGFKFEDSLERHSAGWQSYVPSLEQLIVNQ